MEMKKSLRNVIAQVQQMELEGYKQIILKEFVAKVTEIFKLTVYNQRKAEFNKDNISEDKFLPYDDKEPDRKLTRNFFTVFCQTEQGHGFPSLFSMDLEKILRDLKKHGKTWSFLAMKWAQNLRKNNMNSWC